MNTLKAEKRSLDVKAKRLRREGYVVGNVFGREMKESGTSHACRVVGGVRFRRMTFAAPPRGWWKELRHEPRASR